MNDSLLQQWAAASNTEPQALIETLLQAARDDSNPEQQGHARQMLVALDLGEESKQNLVEEPKDSERSIGERLNQQQTAVEANSLGWLLAYKLFEKHDGLFRKSGKFTQAEGVGRLVHAWLDLLSDGEINDLLAVDDRIRPLTTADAGEWLSRHWKDLDGVVPWEADGLGDLVSEELAEAGRFRDAALRVSRRARVAESISQWHPPFLQLLAMIRLAEELDDAGTEEITDLLSNALRRVGGLGPRAGPAYRSFLIGMHALLRFTPLAVQSAGWLQSLSAIGDHAAAIKQPPFFRLSTVIYEYTLRRLCEKPLIGSSSERWGRARVAANNISGHISTLAGFDAGVKEGMHGDQLILARLMNRMQVISVLGNVADTRQPPDPGRAEDWHAFGFDTAPLALTSPDDTDFDALGRAGTCLRTMNNVLSGWMYLDESLFKGPLGGDWPADGFLGERTSLVLATFGALLRCRHTQLTDQDADEPASSLFNAGLAVARIRRSLALAGEALQMAEMMFYCAGLHFSLRVAGNTARGLRDLHGGSCLVNLAGCATNISRAVREQPALSDAVYRLMVVTQELLQGDGLIGTQRVRIEESMRELTASIKRPVGTGAEPRVGGTRQAQLLDVVEGLVDALMATMKLRTVSDPKEPELVAASAWRRNFEEAAFPALREVCRRVMGQTASPGTGPTTSFAQVISLVPRMLAEMIRLSAHDGTEVLERLVLAPHGDVHAPTVPRQQLCAQSETGDEWRAAFEQLKSNQRQAEPPLTSYTEWLDSPGVLSWLRKVQLDVP